jgi:hypothetical protein
VRFPDIVGRAQRAAPLGGTLLAAAAVTLSMAPPASASASSSAIDTSLAPSGLSAGTPFSGSGARRRPRNVGISLTPSKTEPFWACPEGACEAIVDPRSVRVSGHWALPAGGPLLQGSGEDGGYDPQDLQSAYRIPTSGGSTQTIALVEAAGYEGAEEDLATYRHRYGLASCTKANGCFRKVNENGEEGNYPPADGWELETALDLDMASAACGSCHILLVQAATNAFSDLGRAVDTAATLGATEISNSYGFAEESCGAGNCEEYSVDYDHPGVLITASAGDSGYDNDLAGYESPEFPAASPYVVAVGGTSLRKASNARGWSEEAWLETGRGLGTGGGCSRSEPKPGWQADTGCANRTGNDVAAVAACDTPVSIYATPLGGWANVCGTSVASPLVAGIEAHASAYARSLPGAEAFYSDPGALFDVTTGSSGECAPAEPEYLCNAQIGYDGPTGNGAPDGPLELTSMPPIAATRSASAVTATAATLNGALDPQGFKTSYRFEYGTTTSYGTSVPLPDAPAGAGATKEEVSQAIAGLQPNTIYHYRLVATSGNGSSDGEDSDFKTAPPTVTGVAPDVGPANGGTTVTISGSNLTGATAVAFGSTYTKSFVVSSETSIRAVAPPGSGTVDLTITTPAGITPSSAADRFAYQPSQWSSADVPLPAGSGQSSFGSALLSCSFGPWSCGAASCASPESCVAVGSYESSELDGTYKRELPVADTWDDGRWSLDALPLPEGTGDQVALTGVSCGSLSTCLAVGYERNTAGVRVPIAERLNGAEGWSVSSVPLPAGAGEAGLEGVSCSSSTECTAVGLSVDGSGAELPYAELWSAGAWTELELPAVPGAANAILESVSCPSAESCVAVGFSESSAGAKSALSESWSGGPSWSSSSPQAPAEASSVTLSAVSCAAPNACMAVGTFAASQGQAGLTEQWNGERWSLQAPASTGAQEELTGVSCPSSEECTAVGAYLPNGRWVALVQTWNGAAWSVQGLGLTRQMKQASELHAVSCAGGSTCLAVGIAGWSAGGRSRSGSVQALAELRSTAPLSSAVDPPPGPAGAAEAIEGSGCASSATITSGGATSCTIAAPTPEPPLNATPPTPTIRSLSETAKTWREHGALAAISLEKKREKPPLGTMFSFSLNEAARVTFTFTEPAGGRGVGKICMAPTEQNRHERRCARTVIAATLTFAAHAGTDKVRFDGLIAERKRLEPGSYTLVVTATASGKRSTARALQFTIAKG